MEEAQPDAVQARMRSVGATVLLQFQSKIAGLRRRPLVNKLVVGRDILLEGVWVDTDGVLFVDQISGFIVYSPIDAKNISACSNNSDSPSQSDIARVSFHIQSCRPIWLAMISFRRVVTFISSRLSLRTAALDFNSFGEATAYATPFSTASRCRYISHRNSVGSAHKGEVSGTTQKLTNTIS
jgi:hypothetical protein